MVALSPFQYVRLCRYILQQYLSQHPPPVWKGKARQRTPRHVQSHHALSFAGVAMEHGSYRHDDFPPVAGPSTTPLPPNPRSRREPLGPDPKLPSEPREIYRLMNDERLLVPGGTEPPREVIVLCHGLYGFSTATPIPLFPSLKLHYWSSVLKVLRERIGADVVVVGVNGTGSIKERAEQMHKYLSDKLPKGTGVNFVAHSMGGLDVRHLISTIKPTTYTPLSLTSIGTPHHGSPFMDWCAANIGVGYNSASSKKAVLEATRKLPYSLKSPLLARTEEAIEEGASFAGLTGAMSKYLLSIFDSPAYSNLTTSFLQEFNPQTPDDPKVKYFSVAGRTAKLSVLHPLWFPKLVLDAAAEKGYPPDDSGADYEGNDGLVSVKSAKWGHYMGAVDDTHHWDLRGEGGIWPNGLATDDAPESKDKPAQQKKSDKEKDGLILPGAWDWADDVEEYLGLNLLTSSDKKAKKGELSKDNGREKKDDGGWDIAQVGQLLDWVTDAIPGTKTSESGKRQIQEARDESEKSKTGKKEGEIRDKFDLAKFYGALMLKLREEGL